MVTTNTKVDNITIKKKITIIMSDNFTTTVIKEGHLPVDLPIAATKAIVVPSFKKSLV